MKKLLLSAFLLILSIGFANADSIKLGFGKFDDGKENYESDMQEITYVFSSDFGFEPIVGALTTNDDASMIYVGVQKEIKLGRFVITPSFAPGYYDDGSGKKLGNDLEFKSQIDIGFEVLNSWLITYAFSHISNAGLGSTNPGADNQMIFLAKNF